MTRQQLAERHGARQEDADAVQRWARTWGLSVTRVDLPRRQVHLVGKVEAMSRAFGVTLKMYEHGRTRTEFRCPTGNIQIPSELNKIVTGVFGLNDMPVVVRNRVLTPRRPAATRNRTQGLKLEFPGSFFPNEVAKLYNFPPTQGQGQSVAILEFGGGFDQSALADYFNNQINVPAPHVNAQFVMGATMDIQDGATL